MKITRNALALAALLTATSQGATSIVGIVGGQFKGADNATNIPVGSLVLLVVDGAGVNQNGFLDASESGPVVPGLTATNAKTVTVAQAGNLSVGSSFGGDTIVSAYNTTAAGQIGSILTGVDISAYVNRNFAIVWFSGAVTSANIAGQYFGMIRLSDWTLPASDSGGTFTMNALDASGSVSYYSTSTFSTATQVGGGFFTGTGTAADGIGNSTAVRGATFQVVPEPSTALLGAISALGLLRRRRN